MHYVKHEISKQLLDWCIKHGYADAGLMSKWRKAGYEQLCCVQVRAAAGYELRYDVCVSSAEEGLGGREAH